MAKTRIPNLTLPKQKHPYYKNEWGQLHQIGTNHILYVLKKRPIYIKRWSQKQFQSICLYIWALNPTLKWMMMMILWTKKFAKQLWHNNPFRVSRLSKLEWHLSGNLKLKRHLPILPFTNVFQQYCTPHKNEIRNLTLIL